MLLGFGELQQKDNHFYSQYLLYHCFVVLQV